MSSQRLRIGVVGPCKAGKSTLIAGLQKGGWSAHHIAQEHSYVPDMWRKVVDPHILIYLDVSLAVALQRRALNLSAEEYEETVRRLSHARQHCSLYLDTDPLSPTEVLSRVLDHLENARQSHPSGE